MAENVDQNWNSRPFIACDACGTPNPPNRCKRCASVFYCSKSCQRNDWRIKHKESCRPIEVMWVTIPSLGPTATDFRLVPQNTTCGICLEEPIKKPVVLSQCKHAFCYACLENWQGFRKVDTSVETNWCPCCRHGIPKSSDEDVLETTMLLASRALSLHKDDENRETMLRSSIVELNAVLKVNEFHSAAADLKAQIMLHVDPGAAAALVGYKVGHMMNSHYGDVPFWPDRQPTPQWLFPVRIEWAQAREAAGQWEHARSDYQQLSISYAANIPMNDWGVGEFAEQFRTIAMGSSRCSFRMGDYANAINCGMQVVSSDRQAQGGHKLVAMAQRALAQQRGYAPRGMPEPSANTFDLVAHEVNNSTLGDAIRTMRRGYIYEAPWDEENKQTNQAFLIELLAEADVRGAY